MDEPIKSLVIKPVVMPFEALRKILGLPPEIQIAAVRQNETSQLTITLVDLKLILYDEFIINIIEPAKLEFFPTQQKGSTVAESRTKSSTP